MLAMSPLNASSREESKSAPFWEIITPDKGGLFDGKSEKSLALTLRPVALPCCPSDVKN
jgi:hypothetical protein